MLRYSQKAVFRSWGPIHSQVDEQTWRLWKPLDPAKVQAALKTLGVGVPFRPPIVHSADLEPSVGEIDALARAARLEYRARRTQRLRDFINEEGISLANEE